MPYSLSLTVKDTINGGRAAKVNYWSKEVMNHEMIVRKDREFSPYLELATKGFFPLFDSDFMDQVNRIDNRPLVEKEKHRFLEIVASLSRYQSLKKKQVYLSALHNDDLLLFTRGFLRLVEAKVLDERPTIH